MEWKTRLGMRLVDTKMLIAYDPLLLKPGNLDVQRKMGGTVPEEILLRLFPETSQVGKTWLMTLYEVSEEELELASLQHTCKSNRR